MTSRIYDQNMAHFADGPIPYKKILPGSIAWKN